MFEGERIMQIVTDSGADLWLSKEEMTTLGIHIVPLTVTLNGNSYQEGVDIETEEFYSLLANTDNLPTTSQPSTGDFAETYRRIAAEDPEILSIHISSGLSGTVNSARAAVEQVPEARVTVVDTKTLSAAAGWQVIAAAKAAKADWTVEEILPMIKRIGDASDSMYTLKELKYLIHGGRISHMRGLIASVLNLKPLIGVETEGGTYVQLGAKRAFNGAVRGLVDLIEEKHEPGSALRVQVLHSMNPEGAEMLKAEVDDRFECDWLPMGPMSLVLGAHTGPSMVGVAFAPKEVFEDIPA
jgi:DegV family protein with EDD domain